MTSEQKRIDRVRREVGPAVEVGLADDERVRARERAVQLVDGEPRHEPSAHAIVLPRVQVLGRGDDLEPAPGCRERLLEQIVEVRRVDRRHETRQAHERGVEWQARRVDPRGVEHGREPVDEPLLAAQEAVDLRDAEQGLEGNAVLRTGRAEALARAGDALAQRGAEILGERAHRFPPRREPRPAGRARADEGQELPARERVVEAVEDGVVGWRRGHAPRT
jgi:hypothetical protein